MNFSVYTLLSFFVIGSLQADICKDSVMGMLKVGEFFHKKNSKLHTNQSIETTMKHFKVDNSQFKQKPSYKIASWFQLLEQTHLRRSQDSRVKERLRNYYHKKHIIKEEDIPESYWDKIRRAHEERGEDIPEISQKIKKEHFNIISEGQKESLDRWFDYFLSPDSNSFPVWAKYWVFDAVTKMGHSQMLGSEEMLFTYTKRTKHQVAPFPELNREILAKVVGAFIRKVQNEGPEHLNDAKFLELTKGASFSKMYAHEFDKFKKNFLDPNNNTVTEGKWVKYKKDSDPSVLVASLEGKSTGWCTAETATANKQLKGGDFYVYYSLDDKGEASFPRIAIRMNGEQIAEVRGVGNDQNLDQVIVGSEVLSNKLGEFGARGKRYLKRDAHMKRLTKIYTHYQEKGELSEDQLRFLYEIDEKIQGFGYSKDKRIEKILANRNQKSDLSFLIGIPEDKISLTQEEFMRGGFIYHYGSLDINKVPIEIIQDLKFVKGNLIASKLTSAKGLENLYSIGGNAYFEYLTSAKSLKNLSSIGESAYFYSLKSAKGLESLSSIGENGYFYSLKSAKGLENLSFIGGSANFEFLTSAKGLENLFSIGEGAYFESLASAKGLENLFSIGGDAIFHSLKSANGLGNLSSIGGEAIFESLTSSKGLDNLSSVEGSVFNKYAFWPQEFEKDSKSNTSSSESLKSSFLHLRKSLF